MKKVAKAALRSGYDKRQRTLALLGFDTYAGYLNSPLWKGIRARVLARDLCKCRLCEKREATEVHHSHYRRKDLLGETLVNLFSVCRKCHEFVEFNGSEKLSVGHTPDRMRHCRKLAGLRYVDMWKANMVYESTIAN